MTPQKVVSIGSYILLYLSLFLIHPLPLHVFAAAFLPELRLTELLCVYWLESSSCLKVLLPFALFSFRCHSVFSLLCCYRVDTHPTPRSLANHSSDCFLSNNTKYDPILYFPVLYSITRFILLVAVSQGQGHKPNLSNVVQTVIGRAGRLKDRCYNWPNEDGRT